jgi:hypothetical protein
MSSHGADREADAGNRGQDPRTGSEENPHRDPAQHSEKKRNARAADSDEDRGTQHGQRADIRASVLVRVVLDASASYAAQHESFSTSAVNVCAVSLTASDIVR